MKPSVLPTYLPLPLRRRHRRPSIGTLHAYRAQVRTSCPDAYLVPLARAHPQLPTGTGGGALCAKPGSLVDIAVEPLALHSLNHVPGQRTSKPQGQGELGRAE